MELLVSQGKILTLAPFCKSFAPHSKQLKGGVVRVGSEYVSVFSEHLCVLWQRLSRVCCPAFLHIFQHGVKLLHLLEECEVKAPKVRQRPRPTPQPLPDNSICLVVSAAWGKRHQQIHTAWTMQPLPEPAHPFVNRHFYDNYQCWDVPNQYTQSGELNRHR